MLASKRIVTRSCHGSWASAVSDTTSHALDLGLPFILDYRQLYGYDNNKAIAHIGLFMGVVFCVANKLTM